MSNARDTLSKRLHDFLAQPELLQRGQEHFTSAIKDFIGYAKVSMDVWHRSANIVLGPIKLVFEVGAELLFEYLHLVRVLELLVMAGKLCIAHDPFHEVLDKECHLAISTELVVEGTLFGTRTCCFRELTRRLLHWGGLRTVLLRERTLCCS